MANSQILCARVPDALANETRAQAAQRQSTVSAAIRSGLRAVLQGGEWEQKAQKELLKAAKKGKVADVAEVAGLLVSVAPSAAAAKKVERAALDVAEIIVDAQKVAPTKKKAAKKKTSKPTKKNQDQKKKTAKKPKTTKKKASAKKKAAKKATAKKKASTKKTPPKGLPFALRAANELRASTTLGELAIARHKLLKEAGGNERYKQTIEKVHTAQVKKLNRG